MKNTKVNTPLTKQNASELLFAKSFDAHVRNDCFDMYGNYNYPTDAIVNTPNNAVGSSDVFLLMNINNLKE